MSRFRLTLLVGCLLLASCGPAAGPPPSPDPIAPPEPQAVESVLFLVGDPGLARTGESPLLVRLQDDIEFWAANAPTDSAVVVAVLGDIVYPDGLHAPGHPSRDADTSVVMSQVRLVLGPAARARGARVFFVAGNHDWGTRRDREGLTRLRNLDDLLHESRARTGAEVRLVPELGTGGPYVVDLGTRVRLVLLDTAWWLLSADGASRAAVLAGVERAVASRGTRDLVIAAHHPFRSVGPHGGFFPLWSAAGVRYLLTRSGAILQDLTSRPYRELENGLRDIFRRHGAPLVFAGGHEHSLQVIDAIRPTDPRHILVSGSASKLSGVGIDRGVRYAASEPGYMRVVVERGGGVSLFVEAGSAQHLRCEAGDASCLASGLAAFRTSYAQRLR